MKNLFDRRNLIGIGIILVLIGMYMLFHRKSTNLPQRNIEPKVENVTISQAFQHILYIGLYVAKDAGFFKEQGLNVKIETAGGDDKTFAALVSGSADFCQGDPAFVAIAGEKRNNFNGFQSKVILMAVDRAAFWGVTLNQNIEFSSSAELFRDKKVATYPNPNTSYVIQKNICETNGLRIGTDTEIIQTAFGSEIGALKAGAVDIAHTIEPNVSTMESQGAHVVYSYPDSYGPLAFTGLMTSEKLIKRNPVLVQKVINAYEKALKFVHEDFEGTVSIAENYLPDLEDSIVRKALARLIDSQSIPSQGTVNFDSWNKLLQIRVDVGDLDSFPRINYVDNSFSLKALNQ